MSIVLPEHVVEAFNQVKPSTVPPKTIAVDFDGTLCDHEYPKIGHIKSGAKEALMLFQKLGYRIIIWSCRTCHWHYDIFGGDPKMPTMERVTVKQMVSWLNKWGIPYDEVDDGSRGKPLANLYIDDRAIRFDNNWDLIAQVVRSMDKNATL